MVTDEFRNPADATVTRRASAAGLLVRLLAPLLVGTIVTFAVACESDESSPEGGADVVVEDTLAAADSSPDVVGDAADVVESDADAPEADVPATSDVTEDDAGTACPLGPDDPRCETGDPCVLGACSVEEGGCVQRPACDDGDPCTDDHCAEDGTCSHEPACDDGDPCTADACAPDTGECSTRWADGAECQYEEGCGTGVCREGQCIAYEGCDDVAVCTEDLGLADGSCSNEVIDPVGRPALDFEMEDTNPYSATFGQTFSLETLEGKVVVLVFVASGCDPCCVQGEAARPIVEDLKGEEDVFIAAVDVRSVLLGGTTESVENCVTTDVDDVPPLVSSWPYLRDNDEWQVWNRYCAANYYTVVIDADRTIQYYRPVNFEDPPFRDELRWAIDRARGLDVPAPGESNE